MPRFNSPRDVRFFRQISTEMVDDVIETPVVIYKLNVGETSYNLYGESLAKQYYSGFETFCVIQREDTATNYEGFGAPIIEANSCGTLAIATDLPVIREISNDYNILIPNDMNNVNWQEISWKLSSEEAADNAQEFIKNNYSVTAIAETLRDLYN
mgnify:CR=1 FL=1